MRRGNKASLLAGAATVMVAAGIALSGSPAHAIANGEPVKEGRYGFSVKLTMTGIPVAGGGTRNSACSGALISPQWVVTAGHCFRDENGVRVERPVAQSTTATIARTDLQNSPGGHVVEIVAVRQSPTADVALVKLETKVKDVRPLRVSAKAPVAGDVLRLTGYGSLQSENPIPATRLYTGTFTVESLQAATLGVRGKSPQADTSPCPYDSGGAFFRENGWPGPELVAVVSNGPSCPHSDIESPARTDNLAAWIKGITTAR